MLLLKKCLRQSVFRLCLYGALAISFYGVPRTTSDIDVMISVANETNVKPELLEALQLAGGFTIDERKIDMALNSGFRIGTFKDKTSPYSIDIIYGQV
jgi:predicted nucleotidyltransferase